MAEGLEWSSRRVQSEDGTELVVYQSGRDPGGGGGAPTVFLVHGYPDDHRVWDQLAAQLAPRFHVVAFDVRGAGQSQRPSERRAYAIDRLAADIVLVAGLVGGKRVHLVGHDWGSVQSWHAVTDEDAPERFASFTSISGPDLVYTREWIRGALRKDRPAALRQLRSSWYIGMFQLPVVPELLWRSGLAGRLLGAHGSATSRADAIAGLELYRANVGTAAAREPSRCLVPTLVLAPRADRYVTAALATQAPQRWTDDLRAVVIEGGHWTLVRHPERVSTPLTAFIDDVLTR